MGQAGCPVLPGEAQIFAGGQVSFNIVGACGEFRLGLLVGIKEFLGIVDLARANGDLPDQPGIVCFAGRRTGQRQQSAGRFKVAARDGSVS